LCRAIEFADAECLMGMGVCLHRLGWVSVHV